ncbi:MAG: hypothetical protein AB1696_10700 [Planctomycetota bacterium]
MQRKRKISIHSAPHRRGVATTLTLLDEMLCKVEEWAKGREARSVLYQECNTLSPRQKSAMLSQVTETKALLRQISDDLGLRPEERSVASEIWAMASALREHVMELEGRYMRRYGDVPTQLADYLDARSAELLGGMDRLMEILSGKFSPDD